MHCLRSFLRPSLPLVAFGAGLAAQGPLASNARLPHAPHAPREALDAPAFAWQTTTSRPVRTVFDQPGDGRIWALGTTYKASFGADGFVYVPFLGSDAPRNYPVRFVLRSLRVAGQAIDLARDVTATRTGDRVTLDRGAVREVYDLAPEAIEQTFVVDGTLPGDVDVELAVQTELRQIAAADGLALGNELGCVHYGSPYLVRDSRKDPIGMTWTGGVLHLHVAASQRGAGPVVIDPLITTKTFAPTVMASEVPDIAYDATTDRWLVTWVHIFSATDHDVLAELRNAAGDAVPGSFKAIEATPASYSFPRVANLNSADRFLIAMERVPQAATEVFSVWGRTMDAGAPFTTSSLLHISPNSGEHQNNVDVGGDPGTGTNWTVVWVFGRAVYARQVRADGSLSQTLIPITPPGPQSINPQISLSNGNGLTSTPAWCIVFNRLVTATDGDILAAFLELDGTLVPPRRLESFNGNDLFACVSSPMTDVAGRPAFLVCWDRQGTPAEMVATVIDRAATIVPEVNLTRRYGYNGTFFRVESDGCRFAAMCQTGSSLRVGTLALAGNDLVQHETPQTLGTGGWPFLASKRSGGGGNTDYGIAYVNTNHNPFRIGLALYEGRSPAGGFNRRNIGCGLGIVSAGRPALGDAVDFTLGNVANDQAALLLGMPAPAVPLCGNCGLGVDPTGPLLPLPAPLSLRLPRVPTFVGATLTVQGVAIGSGSCPGTIRLSDAVDFTIQ